MCINGRTRTGSYSYGSPSPHLLTDIEGVAIADEKEKFMFIRNWQQKEFLRNVSIDARSQKLIPFCNFRSEFSLFKLNITRNCFCVVNVDTIFTRAHQTNPILLSNFDQIHPFRSKLCVKGTIDPKMSWMSRMSMPFVRYISIICVCGV